MPYALHSYRSTVTPFIVNYCHGAKLKLDAQLVETRCPTQWAKLKLDLPIASIVRRRRRCGFLAGDVPRSYRIKELQFAKVDGDCYAIVPRYEFILNCWCIAYYR